MNAILCGLVGVTAGCNNVSVTGAAIIGCISTLVYKLSTKHLIRWEVDDPIEAS